MTDQAKASNGAVINLNTTGDETFKLSIPRPSLTETMQFVSHTYQLGNQLAIIDHLFNAVPTAEYQNLVEFLDRADVDEQAAFAHIGASIMQLAAGAPVETIDVDVARAALIEELEGEQGQGEGTEAPETPAES